MKFTVESSYDTSDKLRKKIVNPLKKTLSATDVHRAYSSDILGLRQNIDYLLKGSTMNGENFVGLIIQRREVVIKKGEPN